MKKGYLKIDLHQINQALSTDDVLTESELHKATELFASKGMELEYDTDVGSEGWYIPNTNYQVDLDAVQVIDPPEVNMKRDVQMEPYIFMYSDHDPMCIDEFPLITKDNIEKWNTVWRDILLLHLVKKDIIDQVAITQADEFKLRDLTEEGRFLMELPTFLDFSSMIPVSHPHR